MRRFFRMPPFLSAIVLGFLFLIPLILLEIINRWKFNEGFPYTVFTFTWVLQTVFFFVLLPMITMVRAGESLIKEPIQFLGKIAILLLIAYIWGNWILDQWPCLMGVPNCD